MNTDLTVMPDYNAVEVGSQILWKHPIQEEPLSQPAYLHGELEALAGFDIVYHIPSQQDQIVELPNTISGKFDVNVWMTPLNRDQIWKEGVLYWWIVKGREGYCNRFQGLIVSPDDQKSIDYAEKHQKELSASI